MCDGISEYCSDIYKFSGIEFVYRNRKVEVTKSASLVRSGFFPPSVQYSECSFLWWDTQGYLYKLKAHTSLEMWTQTFRIVCCMNVKQLTDLGPKLSEFGTETGYHPSVTWEKTGAPWRRKVPLSLQMLPRAPIKLLHCSLKSPLVQLRGGSLEKMEKFSYL